MSQTIVRLQGLELRNIKNVEFGKIEMPNSYQNEKKYNNSEILGLYGQMVREKQLLLIQYIFYKNL